jgi:glycosyltransferase involved in cell wall biosynthesis
MDHSAELDHPQNHKNSAFAVDVALECFRENNAHVLFAGLITEALPILKDRIARAGLEDRFHFLGIRKDIERLMLGSDVLFFPSRGEGLGMVAVEAQAAGLRVLASSAVPRECVVIPELVRFKDLNAPTAEWSKELKELLAQPRSDCSESNAKVAASAFSIDNCNVRLQRLYRDGAL